MWNCLLLILLAEPLPERIDFAIKKFDQKVEDIIEDVNFKVSKEKRILIKYLKEEKQKAIKLEERSLAVNIQTKIDILNEFKFKFKKDKLFFEKLDITYEDLGNKKFALVRLPATWHVARQICESLGGHLATLETTEEYNLAKRMCEKNYVWLGATDEETEGEWFWITGFSLNWQENTGPDNSRGVENSLQFSPQNKYNDHCGEHKFWFFCEFEQDF